MSASDGWRETELHRVARSGDEASVARALAAGASLEARDILGFTALHVAAAEGHGQAIEALLSAGATVDARSLDNLTPLMLACRRGHLAAVDWLCVGGANLGSDDRSSPSVLEFAAAGRSLPALERLIEAGLRVQEQHAVGYFRLVLELTGHKVRFAEPGASWGSAGETPSVWAVDRPMRVPGHLLGPIGGQGPLKASRYTPAFYREFESRPDTFANGPRLSDPEQLGGRWTTDWAHEVRCGRLGALEPVPGLEYSTLGCAVDREYASIVVALLRAAGLDPRAVAAETKEERAARVERQELYPRHFSALDTLIAKGLKAE